MWYRTSITYHRVGECYYRGVLVTYIIYKTPLSTIYGIQDYCLFYFSNLFTCLRFFVSFPDRRFMQNECWNRSNRSGRSVGRSGQWPAVRPAAARGSIGHRSGHPFVPLVLPSVRPGNDISLRLERRGAVVSALALCLPCNSNDVYRSCYRGYTLFLSFSIPFRLCLGSRTRLERRKYPVWALIRLGGYPSMRSHTRWRGGGGRGGAIKRYIHLCPQVYRSARSPPRLFIGWRDCRGN